MAVKKNRVLKKDWKTFFSDFNHRHAFKRCRITRGEKELCVSAILAGIWYDENAREITVLTDSNDPASPVRPVCSVNVPRGVFVIIDADNSSECGVQIQGKPGSGMVRVEIVNHDTQAGHHDWIKSVAHRIFENRGKMEGSPEQDWLNAEEYVNRAVLDLSSYCKQT